MAGTSSDEEGSQTNNLAGKVKSGFVRTLDMFRKAIARYNAYAAKKAEQRLARQQAINEEIARKTKQEQERLIAERKLRHQKLIECLSDDFNQLESDLSEMLMFIGEKNLTKYMLPVFQKLGPHGLNIDQNEKEVKKAFAQGIGHSVRRTVADMSEREVGILKLLSLMNTLGLVSDKYFNFTQLCIVYDNGKTILSRNADAPRTKRSDTAIFRFLEVWLETEAASPSVAVNESIATIGNIRRDINDPEIRQIIDREIKGASGWLRADSL